MKRLLCGVPAVALVCLAGLCMRLATDSFVGHRRCDRRHDLNVNGIVNGLDVLYLRPSLGTQCT
jgi:hypothetical protein